MKNKQNEVSQDGWKKGSKTIKHRGFTESIKKHTEDNQDHRKHRHSEGDGYTYIEDRQVTGRNTEWLHW